VVVVVGSGGAGEASGRASVAVVVGAGAGVAEITAVAVAVLSGFVLLQAVVIHIKTTIVVNNAKRFKQHLFLRFTA
jgi:hypothetical protein